MANAGRTPYRKALTIVSNILLLLLKTNVVLLQMLSLTFHLATILTMKKLLVTGVNASQALKALTVK